MVPGRGFVGIGRELNRAPDGAGPRVRGFFADSWE
jgi:hypothetical protein